MLRSTPSAHVVWILHIEVESAMALSIKNPEAEALAHEIAKQTGESLTQAVTVALKERLLRLSGRCQRPDLEASLLEIARRCAALPDCDERSPDEVLGYDDRGTFN
jgi:antitoxin VapB